MKKMKCILAMLIALMIAIQVVPMAAEETGSAVSEFVESSTPVKGSSEESSEPITTSPYINGEGVTAEGFAYQIIDSNVTITGYEGTDTEVTIPNEIEGCPVVFIESEAFMGKPIIKVTFAENVFSIASEAFSYCSDLECVVFERGGMLIFGSAFRDCHNLKRITFTADFSQVSSSPPTIDPWAFRGCTALTNVYVMDGDSSWLSTEDIPSNGNESFLNAQFLPLSESPDIPKEDTGTTTPSTDPDPALPDFTAGTEDELLDAVANSSGGAVIQLTADITLSKTLSLSQSLTIDGDGHTLTYGGSKANMLVVADGCDLTLRNITVSNKKGFAIDMVGGIFNFDDTVYFGGNTAGDVRLSATSNLNAEVANGWGVNGDNYMRTTMYLYVDEERAATEDSHNEAEWFGNCAYVDFPAFLPIHCVNNPELVAFTDARSCALFWAVPVVKGVNMDSYYISGHEASVYREDVSFLLLRDFALNMSICVDDQLDWSGRQFSSKEVTFDLNGYTLDVIFPDGSEFCFRLDDGLTLNVKNGIIASPDGILAKKGVLNLENVTFTCGTTAIVADADYNNNASDLSLTSVDHLAGNEESLSRAKAYDIVINIKKGTNIKATSGFGIYVATPAELNILGGSVSGETAIYMAGGSLNITGGTVSATGKATDGESGEAVATGDAIVLDYVTSSATPSVTITGGIVESKNGEVARVYTNGNGSLVDVSVSGGSFSGKLPDSFCAEGFISSGQTDANGYYTVVADKTGAQGSESDGESVGSESDTETSASDTTVNEGSSDKTTDSDSSKDSQNSEMTSSSPGETNTDSSDQPEDTSSGDSTEGDHTEDGREGMPVAAVVGIVVAVAAALGAVAFLIIKKKKG